MKKAFQLVADQIADTLVQGVMSRRAVDRSASQGIGDLLDQMVGDEVDRRIEAMDLETRSGWQTITDRLMSVESKLEKLTAEVNAASPEESDSSFPNLKYAKSKYRNVESLLNYVERGDGEGEGGLKVGSSWSS